MTRKIEHTPVDEVEFEYGGKSYAIVEPTLADLKPYKKFINDNARLEGTKVVEVKNLVDLEPIVLVACVRSVDASTNEKKRCKPSEFDEFPKSLLTAVVTECNKMIGASETPEGLKKEVEERGNE